MAAGNPLNLSARGSRVCVNRAETGILIMTEMFRKAKQSRVFQDVVKQIEEVILSGKLLPGQKLPSERELGEKLGTSRGTLREALRILEQKGLIEIKLGVNGGALVKEASSQQMSETLALLIRSQSVSLEHLAEFREGVEGIVASLAAERVTAKDMKELKKLLKAAQVFYKMGPALWGRFVEVDEQIHMALARISRNPIYRFIIETIHHNIQRYYDRFLTGGDEELEENFRDLQNLVNAVCNKKTVEAETVARTHVRNFRSRMDKRSRQMDPFSD